MDESAGGQVRLALDVGAGQRLGLPTRAPNLALLFNRSVEAGSLSGPGLLTRVNDTAAAERAFGSWGVLRQLTGEDLARARELRA